MPTTTCSHRWPWPAGSAWHKLCRPKGGGRSMNGTIPARAQVTANAESTVFRMGDIQICTAYVTVPYIKDSYFGNESIRYGAAGWTYPAAFRSAPVVAVSAVDDDEGMFTASLTGTPSTVSAQIEVFGGSVNSKWENVRAHCIAIGISAK